MPDLQLRKPGLESPLPVFRNIYCVQFKAAPRVFIMYNIKSSFGIKKSMIGAMWLFIMCNLNCSSGIYYV